MTAMLCACSGEQFKFEEPPGSPESLATRDFSASGLSSSRTGDGESKFDDAQVDDIESTLKEALSLNYEEARALLGRLEYQRGNFDAALQVFQGIDIHTLTPRMTKAIAKRTQPKKRRSKGENLATPTMSMHSVSLLIEAILLKAKSLEELRCAKDAAKECKIIIDTVEAALPDGMSNGIGEECKLKEMFHKALELLPKLWKQAGCLDESIIAYRRALIKPWNLDSQRLASLQKDLVAVLLYGGIEVGQPPQLKVWGSCYPKNNTEEAILLLFILMRKMTFQEIPWDPEIIDHLSFALSMSGQFEILGNHLEQAFPGTYSRIERWYLLSLCYSSAGQRDVALNLLRKIFRHSKIKNKTHLPSLLLGAKLCSQISKDACEGIDFAQLVIECGNHQQGHHLMGVAHHLLGVCYGSAAHSSVSDSQRVCFQKESLESLHRAAMIEKDDPEVIFSLGLENAVQRNLNVALEHAKAFLHMVGGSSPRCWKLLALIVSANLSLKDAEAIVDIGLDEMERKDKLEFLRLKGMLQFSQEQPKLAIETYMILLSMIQAERELQAGKSDYEVKINDNFEMEAWQDLTTIYSKLGSWYDSKVCLDKAMSIRLYSPKSWHTKGLLFKAQSSNKEALKAFSTTLSIDPDHVPSMVSTASLLMKLGGKSLPVARSLLMNALRIEPTNHDAWLNLGFLSKMEGSLLQAADCFQAAYELEQSSPVQEFT